MAVPVIETERLRLRGHRADDLAACGAMWNDPVVTRFIGIRGSTPQDVWSRLLRYAGHWALMGFGYWALEDKSSGEFLGELGFAYHLRVIEPPIDGMPELGWALVPRAHGKGFATEAVRAAIAWADENVTPKKTVCIVHPDNVASLRVAEKCGYVREHETTFNAEPAIIFVRER